MTAPSITLWCRSGHHDCTVDCGWCKGTGIEKHPVHALSVARRVAEDFQTFESAREMPLFHYERDVEIVLWTLRCLANPLNGWSVPALASITEQAASEAPTAPVTGGSRSTEQGQTATNAPYQIGSSDG